MTALKIKVQDVEDVMVLSALFQDTLIPISALDYDKKAQRFVLMGFRFKWENELEESPSSEKERVFSGISFSHITGIRYIGFHRQYHKAHMLNLLAIHPQKGKNSLKLIFSGKGEIELLYDQLLAHGQDLKTPWPSTTQPAHAEAV